MKNFKKAVEGKKLDADVAVIGLGSVGSMALWQLTKRGVKAIGFEQFGIGHDRSAVGGESRLFRMAYKEGAEYIPLLKEAKRLWRELESETGQQLLTLNGGLSIGNEECDLIKNVLKCVQGYDIKHVILDYKAASKRFPQHKLRPDEIAILDKESGFMRSDLAVISAAERAKALGADIHAHTKVSRLESEGNGVMICTEGKKYHVKHVIITAGVWASKLLPDYENKISATKLILSWYHAENIQSFKPEIFPIFIRHRDGIELYGAPTLDNSTVKVAMFNSEAGERPTADPDHLDRNVLFDEYVNPEIIREFFVALYPEPVRVNAYMDAYTPDRHGIIGAIRELPNAILATGFSGHGFKMAPVFGKICADILLEGQSAFSIAHLDPHRFQNA